MCMERKGISRIAAELDTSRQALSQMLKRHASIAPTPDAEGKYDAEAVKAFYSARAYATGDSAESLRLEILEQEHRLKKAKADEAESKVMPKEQAAEVLTDVVFIIEDILKAAVKHFYANRTEAERQRIYNNARKRFKRADDFLSGLA